LPLRDLAFASRTLRRSPVFTLTAALTIALGVGASTAIFSVTNAVLLRPLPYKDPSRLVVIYGDLRARNSLAMGMSNETFTDIREGTKDVFEDVTSVFTVRQVLPGVDGTPEQVRVGIINTNFFSVMGGRIVAGRDFQPADGEPQPQPANPQDAQALPPVPAMVMLSHEYWQRRHGGNADILGRNLPAQGPVASQVVGVVAPGFELLFPPSTNQERTPDIWIAARVVYNNANRNNYGPRPIGRLKPGVTLERAQASVERTVMEIRKNFSIVETSGFYARLEPMHRTLVEDVRPAILALMGAVIFLLLIACANVANLLLVRASLRQAELSVRSALGASWWRLVQQTLAEALVLTMLGTIGGVVIAWLGIRALRAIAPVNLPRLDSIQIDPIVLAFAALAGLAAAVIFGLVPAWSSSRLDLMGVLRGSGRSGALGRGGLLRNVVVVVEVALCFVLLIGSGLMFRSLLELQRVKPGFEPNGLLTFQLQGGRGGPPPQRAAQMRLLTERLAGIPGVQSVTAATPFPLAGGFSTIRWGSEEALADNTKYQAVDWQIVQPGYFETIGTPLIEGRTFTQADNDPQRNVVVVDQFLAAKAFPNESAIGKRILVRIRTPEPELVEVIGVVGHQRTVSLSDPGREQVFFTDGFLGFGGTRTFALRTSGDPVAYAETVRQEIAKIDPQYLVTELQPMDALVHRAQASTRFQLMLIGAFALVAALLVGVGLYGVLSTVVRQRTSEIGVRMALGAAPRGILRLVVGHGLRLSAFGIAAGLIAALGLTRLMKTMLVGVGPNDPATFVAMAMLFFAIAAFSSWLPARRAAGLDPTDALRSS
jgi:predicted permease